MASVFKANNSSLDEKSIRMSENTTLGKGLYESGIGLKDSKKMEKTLGYLGTENSK